MKSNGSAFRVSGFFLLLALAITLALAGPGGAWAKGKPPPKDDPPPEPVVWGEPEIVFITLNSESWGLAVADLNGNYKELVDFLDFELEIPTWLPDGSGFLFYSNYAGTPGIYYAPLFYDYVAGTDPAAVDPDTIRLGSIQLAHATNVANGLAWPVASPIWSVDTCTLQSDLPLDATCRIFQIAYGDVPAGSPADHLVYMARLEIPDDPDGLGQPAIGTPIQLTPDPGGESWPVDVSPDWSHDGTRIVVQTQIEDLCSELCATPDDIVVIEIADPSIRTSLILDVPDSTVGMFPSRPRWANTQNLIALYAAHTTEGGRMDLYILDPHRNIDTNVTNDSGYEFLMPTWSPDDRQLLYIKNGTSRDCGDKSKRGPIFLETRYTPEDDGEGCLGDTLIEFPERYPRPHRPHWLAPTDATPIDDWPY